MDGIAVAVYGVIGDRCDSGLAGATDEGGRISQSLPTFHDAKTRSVKIGD
jgi:hypothetical protein